MTWLERAVPCLGGSGSTEAGLVGEIEKTAIGSFHYQKRLKSGDAILCQADVFPMRVLRQRRSWLEKSQRVTQWFSAPAAAELVMEPELKVLMHTFGGMLAKKARRISPAAGFSSA
jgi:hypothetical protein